MKWFIENDAAKKESRGKCELEESKKIMIGK